VSFLASFTDNCPGGSIVCVPASGSSFPKGTTNVVCTATDASGNSSNCSFTVTVNDSQSPSISCPANATVNADPGLCSASGVALGTTSSIGGNCGAASVPSNAPSSYPVGTNDVVWTATDIHGNTNSCTQKVIVSVFQIVSIAREGNNMRVTWTTVGGRTNFV